MNDRFLYEQVRSVLLQEWDPIGINDLIEASDEYDAYVQPICEMLYAGKEIEDIYQYLHWVATDHMCLNGDSDLDRIIAEKLFYLPKTH
ncbi:MAG TPA: hypothetical protein DEU90_09215 [Enterobacter asburiae]|jgi:hypothetical protein|uniref:DUF1871 family protein n=1 Tax=Enterobacter asburiae TaxID=61645 RepID=A0AAQ0EPB4_ENTAS|nr:MULTISPECIES: hypothetical protein [Enterobacter]QBB06590.1 hypothetical protein EVV94_17160 [Enterobacter cloacae]ELO0983535.1 hypothetical protein [Enterobacter asburiae]MBF1985208.1 hypothetical protein [Enterobacter asburiae]MBG0652294.1 hypothetical protein [Enterobacter asburiae]MBJ6585088.1 hypothetical protein [Enterobacter asburiae]